MAGKAVGVLAAQGDFEAHLTVLRSLGCDCFEVRSALDLERCEGLIIPGGESSTLLKLLPKLGLWQPLLEFEKPVWGTCAGAILLAREVANPVQKSLCKIDICIERNAYGRQLDSFITSDISIENQRLMECLRDDPKIEAMFIRAPLIRSLGVDVEILVRHKNDPVMVQSKKVLVSSFHPELTVSQGFHKYFLDLIS